MNWIVETTVQCPHCGEFFVINVDTSQHDYTTIEDCTVCCAPMQLDIRCEPGEVVDVEVRRA